MATRLDRLRRSRRWTRVADRLHEYYLLTRLNRPIGILLLLWPTLWALWAAARGFPNGLVLVVFVLGVILMRSAGCVINDFADRNIDPHVRRTADRPIAAGRVSPREALALFTVLSLVAFALVLLMNWLTVALSFAGAALAATYPFMKRHTYLPQVVLGAAFGWAVPMAFAAQTGEVSKIAWLIFVTNVLWSTAYDTMYAMVDRPDDIRIGVKSTAILFGDMDRAMVGAIQVLVLFALVLVGRELELGLAYYAGLAVAAGFAGYQQYLIKDREPERCFQAFLNNNWFGFSVFAGLFLHYSVAA
ncbi:MAG: 4-hydroxybenzoate octaprenyltransferase [Gammaproteobacteria bacterium]|nr:4-hydroxybenzoate octaprenyltransferase [Gammaproteobacteria bacterium]NIR97154.1 4-hydroxybenzoate octaprenyltransferase [Gammaproteobacteria bacterium]NIT62852.1 4-hydroxybenzoate octaprenyltransferase [Gammaproteobacteria bacterium]NIV19816.1 4-hydroxybenzoate octaprenyltransferase [Gammaproteobacteria bacterium]NIX11349.1 4-hydroxybenzoate octaprenyltransferase [Gammaproteobacteria bacterium]